MSLDKQFHGDLNAAAKGEMITAAGLAVKESAAYSAVERVSGTLHGKKGSFALQHTGIMDRGKPSLNDHRRARFGDRRAGRPDRQDGHHHRRQAALVRVRVRDCRRAELGPACVSPCDRLIRLRITPPLDDAAAIAAVRVAAADRLTRDFGDGHWSAHTNEASVLRDIKASRVLAVRDRGRSSAR